MERDQIPTGPNIFPEALPPEEDVKKLERRVKKDEKQLADNSKKKLK